MIKFKPSSRLGPLNEENFTSDPAARGWTKTGSLTFGAAGATLSATGTNVTGELVTYKPVLKTLSFTYLVTSDDSYRNSSYFVKLYVNDVLVHTFEMSPQRLEYGDNTGGAVCVVINNPASWVVTQSYSIIKPGSGSDLCVRGVSSVNVGSGVGKKIELKMSCTGQVTNTTLSLSNLKWI